MNQTFKNMIGAAIGLAVLALGYSAISYVNSYGKSIQPSSFRSFAVSGDGKAVSIPDIAEFSFQNVTEGGADLGALQAQNTDAVNKVIAFVKAQGVDAKDIKTQSYNVNPRYQNYNCYDAPVSSLAPVRGTVSSGSAGSGSSSSSGGMMVTPPSVPTQMVKTCPPPSIVGYTVTQSVDVKIRDFKKIGDIMGGVVTNGANQVGSLAFTLDDPTKAQDDARSQAITKAKAKAELVAQAGGFSLGRLLNIQENGNNPYPMYKSSYSMDSTGAAPTAAPAPSIEPGSQETTVTVTMTYEIK